MAYHTANNSLERSYTGPAAQPPTPRGHDRGGSQQQGHNAQQQHYNEYSESAGQGDRGDYFGDYSQAPAGYAPNYPNPNQPPPGRGGRPMIPGRGGAPPSRGPPQHAAGPSRGGYPAQRARGYPMGPASGRGRGGMERGPGPNRPGPGPGPGPSPGHEYSGPRRPQPSDQADYMTDRMASMDINNRPGPRRSSLESQQTQSEYSYPQQLNQHRNPPPGVNHPPRGYDSRQGAGSGAAGSDYNGQSHPYNEPRQEFGPPSRSMTMPVSSQRQQMPSSTYDGGMPHNGPAGKSGPSHSSMTAGHRPSQQSLVSDTYSHDSAGNQGGGPYRGSLDNHQQEQAQASVEDVFDSYYGTPAQDNGHDYEASQHQQSQHQPQPSHSSFNDYNNAGGFQGGTPAETQRSGAHQVPQLHDARSMAKFGEPQAAVFEMVGDTPSMPPIPQAAPYQGGYNQEHSSYNLPARGPSAPPGPVRGPPGVGYPGGPSISRQDSGFSHRTMPESSSHPVPIRPGQMPNSLVNPNDRPPPVRNYGGIPQAAQQSAPIPQAQNYQPQGYHQHQSSRQMSGGQYSPPPQSVNGPNANVPPPAKEAEPPVTTQELEQLRMVIKNNPNDQESALKLAKKLIEASDALVTNIPDPRARLKARERYLMDAYKVLKKLSSAQNQDAMFLLADSLGRSLFGNEPDGKEAFTLYQSAAKLGHGAAAYRTAVCCEIGHEEGGGTRKDPLKAMQWYKRAATLGDPPAMYKIGMILLKGLLGQHRNPREAVGWLKRAAERADTDNPHALHELGLLYESARPDDAIVRDEAYALSLFQQAADLGYKFSQFRLGCAYEYGLMGCPIDPRLSIVWYSRAAMQEEHQSELALSGWYLTGSDNVLSQSDTEAYLWARKAAVAGLPKAEYAMGYFTEVGIGIPPNLEDAKRWYWRAAAQDFPKARERLEDLKRMGKNIAPRPRERFSRSGMERRQEGECTIM